MIADNELFDREVEEAGGKIQIITPLGVACVVIESKAFGDDLETIILFEGTGPFTMSTFFVSGDRKGKEFMTPLTPTHFAVLKVLEQYAPKKYEMRGVLDLFDEENIEGGYNG